MKFLTILCLLSLSGCASLKEKDCADPDSVATQLTTIVVNSLQCKNREAVQKAVAEKVAGVNLCKDPSKLRGIVGAIACPPVVKGVTALVAGQIPAEWQCDVSAKKEALDALLTAGCAALVPW